MHPFPSALDGLVVAGVALIAGGAVPVAFALGLSMAALQCSIGAVNDLHDAPTDAGRQPPKPIPSGRVSRRQALSVAVGAALLGLAAAWAVGPQVLGLAVVVLVIGYGYDLLAKGTAWSWLPFALGVPVLPVYGWVGASTSVPPFFLALVPMAVLAGTALAIANARADVQRDLAAGTESIAIRLGDERAWRVHLGLWLVVVVVGVSWLVAEPAPLAASVIVALACVVLLWAAFQSRRAGQVRLERAWEAEAVAIAVALAVWLAAVLA